MQKQKLAISLIGSVLFIAILFNVNVRNINGAGRVLDFTTRTGVANVALTLECSETMIHGTKPIRDVKTTTDQKGQYTFNFSDTWDCDRIWLEASKEGYLDTSESLFLIPYPDVLSATVPSTIWIISEQEAIDFKLNKLLESSKEIIISPDGPMPLSEYRIVYDSFIESRKIAKQNKHIEWLKHQYCARLFRLYTKLTFKETGDPITTAPTYEAEVLAFCAHK